MKLKHCLGLIGALAFMASCSSVPVKTIENLKAAAKGETTASTHCAAFSKKAAEEGYMVVANMFAATSYAESLHAAKHLEELAKLGVTDYVPEVDPFTVDSTLANLIAANEGEVYEFTTMYPEFIKIAQEEGAQGAEMSFDWANRAEMKHSKFYSAAIECLKNPTVGEAGINTEWGVCTKCGDTYMVADLAEACELCGTPVSEFKIFKQ